jgi:hypothetical protein
MKDKLLTESFLFEFLKESVEKLDDGSINVKGIIQRADAKNQNDRIYPYDILKEKIDDYMRLVKESRAFGELDHADSPIVNMKNVSHMITEIWWEGKTVWGKVKIMPTDGVGTKLITIINCGGVPGISSRALGSVKKHQDVDIVQEDLQIVCWDFVSEPSTHGAFMKLSEAKEYTNTNKSIIRNSKEKKIITLLDEIVSLKEK